MAAKSKPKTVNSLDSVKVAIYIRVSTQHQIDKASLPVQREELINYTKYILNTDTYELFEDPGYSAKNTDRPAYQQMMSRVRTGEFSHILVWKIDRISRNLLDFAAMYAELKRLGVTFVSKNEQFDTSSAMGEAMLKIILVFAELERNMTSERVSSVMVSRASNGQWNGGKVAFGYKYDKETGEFSFREDEYNSALMIYDLYEEKGSLLAVTKELNARGIRQRSGSIWNPTTVRLILVNPFYTGVYRYNYRNEGSSTTFSYKPENEWVLIENHHPALVSKERQARIIQSLYSRRRGQPGSATYNRKNIHIFAGLLRCGYCGSTMIATQDRQRSDGWRPSVYICSRRRRSDDCQNKFVSDATIGPFIMNYIANIIKASNSFGKSTSIETLQKKLLRGDTFSNVSHIGAKGLQELYAHLQRGIGCFEYEPKQAEMTQDETATERELLLSEKRRLERALNRLRSLYLYSEDAMSEKDYLLEQRQLTQSLESIDERLDELDRQLASSLSISDEEFVAKASYFIMAQQLNDKRYVDYEKFIRKIDPQIVKDFINSVISNFCIKDGRVRSVLFKNGIEHQFYYSDEE